MAINRLSLNSILEAEMNITQMKTLKKNVPQTFMGASSSRRIGCWRKISLETRQSCLISASVICTRLPALFLLPSSSLAINSSNTVPSMSNLI